MHTKTPEWYKAGEERAVTIADKVFAQIQRAIVEGAIPPGSKISEPELARTYGISRGPLREAIGRLEACSLVVRKANVGARVVTLSSQQLLEIYHVREALEGMAARLAATAMSAEEIEDLQELLGLHGDQIAQERGSAYFQKEGDLDFHYRIVQGSHNSRLIELLCNDLYHLVRLYRYQFGMTSRQRATPAFGEHEHIVAAIANRDGEMAELLMRHHVRLSRANVERMLAERAQAQR
ncbi:MAG TPA: GntR family transcriptional regulator [Gammaproteobacteria bacterium]